MLIVVSRSVLFVGCRSVLPVVRRMRFDVRYVFFAVCCMLSVVGVWLLLRSVAASLFVVCHVLFVIRLFALRVDVCVVRCLVFTCVRCSSLCVGCRSLFGVWCMRCAGGVCLSFLFVDRRLAFFVVRCALLFARCSLFVVCCLLCIVS